MSDPASDVLAMACIAAGFVAHFRACFCFVLRDSKLRAHGFWLLAAGFGLRLISDLLTHDTLWAYINTALTAVALWYWWKNGGDDGVKRRLAKLLPRAAPQSA